MPAFLGFTRVRERWRLKLILEKTKWYISTSSGRAWDVHQRAYQDYQTFIHIIFSDFMLTKHPVQAGETMGATERPTCKQVAASVWTIPTSEPQSGLTLWPCRWPLSGWPSHWPAQTMNQAGDCVWIKMYSFKSFSFAPHQYISRIYFFSLTCY